MLFVSFIPIILKTQNIAAPQFTAADSGVTVRLSFTGDLMCHSPQYQSAHIAADSFDFTPCFSELQSIFSESDFLAGNLETVTAGNNRSYSGYPFFNSPDDYVESLKKAGFNFLFTSNNHSYDQTEQGVLRTLEVLKTNGLPSTGTFSSRRDRDSIRVVSIKGIRFALLAFSYGLNGNRLPAGKKYLVNVIDTLAMGQDILQAKSLHPNCIITYLHFGNEYARMPNKFQKGIAQFLKRSGIDLIIASHPHVLQPIEFYKTVDGQLDSGIAAYSLGNFISNQQWRYSDAGAILSIDIKQNAVSKKLSIVQIAATPTWVFKGVISGRPTFRVIPFSITRALNSYDFLSMNDKKNCLQAFDDTRDILTRMSNNIKIK